MADFSMKRNDLLPTIQTSLGFSDGGVPDLTGVGTVVNFIMRKKGATGAPKVDAPAIIVNAATATVRYDWVVGDTNESGSYEAEWEVVYPDGKPQTFPTTAYHTIDILADLDTVVV